MVKVIYLSLENLNCTIRLDTANYNIVLRDNQLVISPSFSFNNLLTSKATSTIEINLCIIINGSYDGFILVRQNTNNPVNINVFKMYSMLILVILNKPIYTAILVYLSNNSLFFVSYVSSNIFLSVIYFDFPNSILVKFVNSLSLSIKIS